MRHVNKGHQFDHAGAFFRAKPRVYIYGTGADGMEMYRHLKPLGCVAGFLHTTQTSDNVLDGVPCRTLDALAGEGGDDFLIIVAAGLRESEATMTKLCAQHGFPLAILFSKQVFIKVWLPVFAMYAHDRLYVYELPFSITERCTLRCEKCNHFTPLNHNAAHRSKDDIYRDLELYFNHVDFVRIGSFVGGEAFLHPDFHEIMEYVLGRYRRRYIQCQVITNGTVMPSDELLALLKRHDTRIVVSDYRQTLPAIAERVAGFAEKVGRSGVELVMAELPFWTDYAIGSAKNGFADENSVARHFDCCDYPCRYLRDGRLYFCTSDAMAQKLGIVPRDDQSYVDLTERGDERRKKMELMEFDCGFVNERGYLKTCAGCYGGWTISPVKIPVAVQCGDLKT